MAIIQDAELEAGFQVRIRWFVSASQRYPADENEYYETFFQTLEPGEEFVLTDSRFNLAMVNDDHDNLEYVIRDFCYVQTLLPATLDFDFYQPGYVRRTATTAVATLGTNILSVENTAAEPHQLTAGIDIQIGPLPNDIYEIQSVTQDDPVATITLTTNLTKTFPAGVDINENASIVNYPNSDAAGAVARVLDNEGLTPTDPVEVTTPLYYDTALTVKRYFYDNALSTPFNGARSFGQTTDRAPITYLGQEYVGRWWAFGPTDEAAATQACLIDNQGFIIACRDGNLAFNLELTYSPNSESSACEGGSSQTYFADHPNFRTTNIPTPQGTAVITNPDGSSPPAGYYAWTSTIAGDVFTSGDGEQTMGQRYVRFWDGSAFQTGVVAEGTVDNCPIPLANSIGVTLHATAADVNCNINGTSAILYYEPIGDSTFTANNVSAIYTNQYGPNSDSPSALSTTYIRAGSSRFLWNGSTLSSETGDCPGGAYCGDPAALNTGSPILPGDFRDDSLCQYQMGVCTDPAASNTQTANPPVTISDDNECAYDEYTASYSVTPNIDGPPAGYTINSTTDTADNGQPWSISSSVTLNSGYSWVTQPDPSSFSNNGTFNNGNVSISITYTGEVEVEANIPAGCNTSGALNYSEGSDGTQECFFSIGDFVKGGSDDTVCTDVGDTSVSTVTLVSSDDDSRIREWDGTMTTGGADGWYADEDGWTQYSNGEVTASGVCPEPVTVPECSGGSVSWTLTGQVSSAFGLSCNYDIESSGTAGPWPGDQEAGFIGFGVFQNPSPIVIGQFGTADSSVTYHYTPADSFIPAGGTTPFSVVCSGMGIRTTIPQGGFTTCPTFEDYTIS